MGKMIGRIAVKRGHEIVLIADEDNRAFSAVKNLPGFFTSSCCKFIYKAN